MASPNVKNGDAVVVTGASKGLGLETAVHLAERGWNVYATVRDLQARDQLDQAVRRRNVRLHVLELNMIDPQSIHRAVNQIVASSGGIYALINNGGIGLRGYFEDLSEEEIRRVFEVNVFGTMAVTRAVLPHMRAVGRGRIVMITSVGGLIGSLGVSAYCSTKFAQEGFGESLYQELAPLGIQVVLVEPAIIKTERWGVNRGNAQKAKDPDSPYYRWFCNSEKLADRLVETSPTTPAHVARTIHRALTASRPKLRYVVGRRAALIVALRRYLPGEFFAKLYFGEAIRRVTGRKLTSP